MIEILKLLDEDPVLGYVLGLELLVLMIFVIGSIDRDEISPNPFENNWEIVGLP